MGQTARTADTTADTSHTLNEVAVKDTLIELKQSHTARLDTVADNGLDLEVNSLLLKSLCRGIGKTAASCKDTAEVGCVVKVALLKAGEVEVTAVKECLKLLVGEDAVNPGLNLLKLCLCLLCGTGANKDNLCIGGMLLDVLCKHNHGRHIVGNLINKAGECGLDISYKCGTAGAGKQTLLGKLLCLCHCDHICTERRLNNIVEAEHLHTRDNLSKLRIGELAGDRGSNDGINLVVALTGITLALFEDVDCIYDIGLIHNRAEGTLIYTGTALDTLAVINGSRLLLVHRDCLYLAGVLAGTLTAYDCGVGADLRAGAALLTLRLIDMCNMVFIKADGTELTNILATVCKTAAAGVGNLVSADGTLVAGDVNNLDDIGVVLVAAHCDLYSLTENSTLLIYAATHCGLLAGCELFGNIHHILKQLVLPCKSCDLTQNLILQMLYFCVKFTHIFLHTP